jgi:outer membrane biosynthesis protein TonB
MKVQVAKSWDFNQMLVASVFGHLVLMTVVIFLPKSTYEEIVITPAFVVELVDTTAGQKKAVQKTARKNKPRKKSTPKPIPLPKKMKPIQQTLKLPPKPKAEKVLPDKSKKVLNKLNQLDKKPPGVIQELEQLAKLVPKVAIKNPVIKTSQPIQEKTFDELNALKNKKLEFKPIDNAEPLPIEDPLDHFENLKMKEKIEVNASAPENVPENKIDSHLKELEFASLSRTKVEIEKKPGEKSAVDLLQELEKIESKPSADNESSETQNQEPAPVQEKSQAYDSIMQKLASLNDEPKETKPDIVATPSSFKTFESDIRKVSTPQQVHVEVVVAPGKTFVQSPNQGEPRADALAKYVGLIHEKVQRNWKNPLGQDHNKLVVFSINIFRKGNIDRPELQKSSRVELLDNLALRAILESEPFPPIPEEIESSYLGISLQFKYTPEKS